MENLSQYIQEALIKKSSNISTSLSTKYVLFVPFTSNLNYLSKNYKENEIRITYYNDTIIYTIFLIRKEEVNKVFNELPHKTLGNDSLRILKIPDNIQDTNELIKILIDSHCTYIFPHSKKDKMWEQVNNINDIYK